jgi:hypothetical protein
MMMAVVVVEVVVEVVVVVVRDKDKEDNMALPQVTDNDLNADCVKLSQPMSQTYLRKSCSIYKIGVDVRGWGARTHLEAPS